MALSHAKKDNTTEKDFMLQHMSAFEQKWLIRIIMKSELSKAKVLNIFHHIFKSTAGSYS